MFQCNSKENVLKYEHQSEIHTCYLDFFKAEFVKIIINSGIHCFHGCTLTQTDIRMPKRHILQLQDEYRNSRMQRAIEKAVKGLRAKGRDCRVLALGAGFGLLSMMALRFGAAHVTAVERWQ